MTVRHKETIAESLMASALRLAAKGFKVFPLEIDGSTPAFEGWQQKATASTPEVEKLWSSPTGESVPFNIGVLTGGGLTVLDVDTKKGRGGGASLEILLMLGLNDETFTVRTKSGGKHLYFASGNLLLRNSVGHLAPGLDVRSEGGYVVGPGSTVGAQSYAIENDLPVAPIDDWFARRCGEARAKGETVQPLVELDTPDAIARATDWLRNEAPHVTAESGNGDITAYKVACHVKDFGISEHECLSLILEVFDETKAHPPQGAEVWERKVENAYRHGLSAPGVRSPMADFEVEELDENPGADPGKPDWPMAEPARRRDPAAIPPRRWIVGNTFARNFTSGIIAPGGMGKTQFAIQAALAAATGRGDIIGRPVIERTAVWYWNQEDDMDELERRLAAAMQHFGVSWSDTELDGRQMLFLGSGVERPLTIAVRGTSEEDVRTAPEVATIIRQIKEKDIGLFIADPLAELHKVTENSNEQMRQVWGILRRIAVECQCAVAVGAHTRKPDGASSQGHAGNADALRGGSSQIGVMRTSLTLFEMSDKDAKAHGINLKDRHLYVRVDDAKTNLFLKTPGANWYKRTSVAVGGLDGQKIGVLAPLKLAAGLSDADLVEHLADAVSRLAPGEHKIAAVLREVEPTCLGLFGAAKNHARTIKELFNGETTVLTDRGVLRLRIADSVGTYLCLEATSSEGIFS